MTTAAFWQSPHQRLPDEQHQALRRAIFWQAFTIAFTLMTIALVATVLGNSQSMKTAWIEDMLSLIPQVSYFIALLVIRRPATKRHPYGRHRAMAVGHLVAGVALLAVGATLAAESALGLIAGEQPTIGTVQLFGHTIWLGWLMVATMALIVVGPLIYGPHKLRVAPKLHNKLLFTDADMAKADWHTNAASIVGVLGVGVGLWWLDGAAAIFISVGIVLDGYRNTRVALSDLMDQRARTVDNSEPHPLRDQVIECALEHDWVRDAGVRVRDQGQVLHVELFVQPASDQIELTQLGALADSVRRIDWKLHDIVVVATDPLPDYADKGGSHAAAC